MYKKNDIVKYIGDYSKLDSVYRDEDFASIIDLIEYEDYWVVNLQLIKSNAKITCLIDLIRPVETEEIHLTRLGFNIVNFGGFKQYERDGVIISSIAIQFPQINFVFLSGLCIGDLKNISRKEIDSYIVDGKFNYDMFYAVYPSVQNINNLFAEIASKKWSFDIHSICC